jgi:N-acetyltransferase
MFDQRPKRRLLSRPNISKNTSLSILSSDIEYEDPSFSSGSERAIRHHSPKHRVPLKTTAINLHQVQLDLGVSAMKQCKACGMEYNSTVPEDRKLHDEYHKTKLKATQPIRTPLGQLSRNITIDGETYEIRVLDSRGPVQSRVHFEQALGTMYMDLPGDEIESADLWSQISNPIKSSVLQQVPRFTVLMLLSNRTPLAILVVERINKGGGYLDDFRSSQTDNDVSIGKSRKGYGKPDVIKLALMSIERIWVDKDFRRKGLATTLIDHARGILIPELKIQRSQVAFSWPTTLGRSLATRYSLGQHDEAIPFLVNFADCPDL